MWRPSSGAGSDMRSNTAASVRMRGHDSEQRAQRRFIQWLPAQCLGQFAMDASVRPWLIGKGLLTLRMKAACGERFGAASGGAVDRPAERCAEGGAAGRRTTPHCSARSNYAAAVSVWVFAQSVDSRFDLVPASVARLNWATLHWAKRCTNCPASSAAPSSTPGCPAGTGWSRARCARRELTPAGLWARRSRILLRGAPLLVQEVFLPAMGRV